MNFSWAMDLDPKGANNRIKELIDRQNGMEDEVRMESNGANNTTQHDVTSQASPPTSNNTTPFQHRRNTDETPASVLLNSSNGF